MKDFSETKPTGLYEAAIGEKNQDYYLDKFEHFDQQGPGFHASWNWAAFFFTVPWTLYRKMYGWFFAWLVALTFMGLLGKIPSVQFASGLLLVNVILWIGFTAYANSLYHRKIKARIAAAQKPNLDASRVNKRLSAGAGVHMWVPIVSGAIPVIGIVAAVALPAYQDYAKRQTVAASPAPTVQTGTDWDKGVVTPPTISNFTDWVKVEDSGIVEISPESIVRDGALLRYAYRERVAYQNNEASRPFTAAVHCATRQRSEIQADGSMNLVQVFLGTRRSAELDYVCQFGRFEKPVKDQFGGTLVNGSGPTEVPKSLSQGGTNLKPFYGKLDNEPARKPTVKPQATVIRESAPPVGFSAEVQADLNFIAARAISDYPYLDTPDGQVVRDLIIRRRNQLIQQGVYPSIALTQAVNAYAPANAPRPVKEKNN